MECISNVFLVNVSTIKIFLMKVIKKICYHIFKTKHCLILLYFRKGKIPIKNSGVCMYISKIVACDRLFFGLPWMLVDNGFINKELYCVSLASQSRCRYHATESNV